MDYGGGTSRILDSYPTVLTLMGYEQWEGGAFIWAGQLRLNALSILKTGSLGTGLIRMQIHATLVRAIALKSQLSARI